MMIMQQYIEKEEGRTLASFPGRVGGEKTSSLLPRGLGTRLDYPIPHSSSGATPP